MLQFFISYWYLLVLVFIVGLPVAIGLMIAKDLRKKS